MQKKNTRSKPEVNFDSNGLAIGWAMNVGKCYRQQLDITESTYLKTKSNASAHLSDSGFIDKLRRDLDVINYHKYKDKKGAEKWAIKAWSQGNEISFDRGHFFAGKPGKKTEKLTLQVLEASPTNSNLGDPGTVQLLVSHAPNGPENATTPVGITNTSQRELLRFLKKADKPLIVGSGYEPSGAKINVTPVEELESKGLCLFAYEKNMEGL